MLPGNSRILVLGGGWTGLTAALEAARTGYGVVLVEKSAVLGGAANNIPVCSPLASPWADTQPSPLPEKIAAVMAHDDIAVYLNARLEKLEGQPGAYTASIATGSGPVIADIGAVVLATGWQPLAERFLAPMGLGKTPKVTHAGQFGKTLMAGEVRARRIAFVLDTTIAEEAATQTGAEDSLESIRHLQYSNVVNSVGMLRLAHAVCEKNGEDTHAFILYRNMTVPGILERFYRHMQDNPGLMMTRARVTDIREENGHMLVACANTPLGMDFALEVDLVVLPTGLVPTTATDAVLQLGYRQGPGLPDLELYDGFADSNYVCFPYETRRAGVYAAGCVRQPLTLDACEVDAQGAVLKAIQCIEATASPHARNDACPVFDLTRCTQCDRCIEECPFGALDDDGRGNPRHNPTRCRHCGICLGACPERVISFPDYSIDQIDAVIRAIHIPVDFSNEGPRVLVFACENDACPALDMAARHGRPLNPSCHLIPVRCLGAVNTVWISGALARGFDGVLLLGCAYGSGYQCHYATGSELCARRVQNLAETLRQMAMHPGRVAQLEVGIDARDSLPAHIDSFVAQVRRLGPNPFKA